MRSFKIALFVASFASIAGVRGVANATPNFPAAIADHLNLQREPDCTLCHVGTPGRGTVTTPFGVSMRDRGLMAFDESTLDTALDALDAEKKDSDGDGIPDITELKAGTDPNVGMTADGGIIVNPTVVQFSPAKYGCQSRVAPFEVSSGLLAAATAMVVGALARRNRKWTRPARSASPRG
jgi:hypothetical protein